MGGLRVVAPPSGVFPIFRDARLFIGTNINGIEAWVRPMSREEAAAEGAEKPHEWYKVYTASIGEELFPCGVMGLSSVHSAFNNSENPRDASTLAELSRDDRLRKLHMFFDRINHGRYGFRSRENSEPEILSKPIFQGADYRQGQQKKRKREQAEFRDEHDDLQKRTRLVEAADDANNLAACVKNIVLFRHNDKDDEEPLPMPNIKTEVKPEQDDDHARSDNYHEIGDLMFNQNIHFDVQLQQELHTTSPMTLADNVLSTLSQLQTRIATLCSDYMGDAGTIQRRKLSAAHRWVNAHSDPASLITNGRVIIKEVRDVLRQLTDGIAELKQAQMRFASIGLSQLCNNTIDELTTDLTNRQRKVMTDIRQARADIDSFEDMFRDRSTQAQLSSGQQAR